MQTVAIVGTGLIGSSFGLALRRAGFSGRILGVSSERSLQAAIECRAIDEGATLESAASSSDLVYLSQTISAIIDTLPRLAHCLKPGALVTDAGSTKRTILQAAAPLGDAFLGGHPMAGKASRGASGAEAALFDGRPYILTPSSPDQMNLPHVRSFCDWIQRAGARLVVLTAAEHDRLVASASHLPQLLSTTLASTLEHSADPAAAASVSGPGLRDMTRLALSSHDIWKDILETNGDEIAAALAQIEDHLAVLRRDLSGPAAESSFAAGRDFSLRLRPGHQD
ncbi:MAG: prephenate dehydrogenase/arogenate dehydrogenase family protein [Candidatus Solibacter sp.]|nr:prephenate dehydrogenase/arogenate dehydrogenase family protein [Candidatus Solibacter sp.]